MPPKNIMGASAVDLAYDEIKANGFKKVLIVSDEGLKGVGIIDQVVHALKTKGFEPVVFSGTQPNPTTKNIEDRLAILKAENCDSIISLGGGFPQDCAKGIALIAINTTAGTASEMTYFCIITDEKRHIKMAIVDAHTTPVLSVNDGSSDMAARETMAYAQFLAGMTFTMKSV